MGGRNGFNQGHREGRLRLLFSSFSLRCLGVIAPDLTRARCGRRSRNTSAGKPWSWPSSRRPAATPPRPACSVPAAAAPGGSTASAGAPHLMWAPPSVAPLTIVFFVIFCGSLDVPPGGSTTTLPATLPSSLQALQQPHAHAHAHVHHHGSQSRSASVIESLAMTDARSDAAFLAKEKVTPRTQCILFRARLLTFFPYLNPTSRGRSGKRCSGRRRACRKRTSRSNAPWRTR